MAQREPADQAIPVAGNAALRVLARPLGWHVTGPLCVEIPRERTVTVGPRTIVVGGTVRLDVGGVFRRSELETSANRVADRAAATLERRLIGDARRVLGAPDDQAARHVVVRGSFERAARDARAVVVDAWRELEAQRTSERIEKHLGLRFYLESLDPGPRRLRYFVGPTNSGKTHAALQALAAATSGIYLAPLRLLALEVYERLNESGVPISLVTGEEQHRHPAETHVSATVEMLPLGRRFDVAVIDEAQMLRDRQRGWAWTLAVAGARAAEVILCGSPEGLEAATKLAQRLGITLDVQPFERKNPLVVDPPISIADLAPHDAVVVFSRREVIETQQLVTARGLTSAAIYGALSPGVRRREAARFREGEADVLVATDAIGMGLNLPIRRIVFGAISKWDDKGRRRLTFAEMRQIAGRAGRYGIHERGHVTSLGTLEDGGALAAAIAGAGDYDEGPVWIAPTDDHLARLAETLHTSRLAELLAYFQTRLLAADDDDLRIADLTDAILIAEAIERNAAVVELPLEVRYGYARAPVRPEGDQLAIITRWASNHAAGDANTGDEVWSLQERDEVATLEEQSRMLVLYRWLARRFPAAYPEVARLDAIRERIDERIGVVLRRRGTSRRRRRT